MPSPPGPDPTLRLPRILCLHGGGVNADVFRIQCRALISTLSTHFRLVFVDGPFICPAHPAIGPVYGNYGPFRRWVRWLPEHPELDDDTAIEEIRFQMRTAMGADDARGASGPWTGVLGFSQGAKIAASLLLTQQTLAALEEEKTKNRKPGEGDQAEDPWSKEEEWQPRWRFGVILAGRAPLVALDLRMPYIKGVQEASGIGVNFSDWPDGPQGPHVLKVPTVHVHGLKDPGLELHRRLLTDYCEKGTTRLVEWDGDHRLPIKAADVQAVAREIVKAAEEAGVVLKN